jgi:hypothetical protein
VTDTLKCALQPFFQLDDIPLPEQDNILQPFWHFVIRALGFGFAQPLCSAPHLTAGEYVPRRVEQPEGHLLRFDVIVGGKGLSRAEMTISVKQIDPISHVAALFAGCHRTEPTIYRLTIVEAGRAAHKAQPTHERETLGSDAGYRKPAVEMSFLAAAAAAASAQASEAASPLR